MKCKIAYRNLATFLFRILSIALFIFKVEIPLAGNELVKTCSKELGTPIKLLSLEQL